MLLYLPWDESFSALTAVLSALYKQGWSLVLPGILVKTSKRAVLTKPSLHVTWVVLNRLLGNYVPLVIMLLMQILLEYFRLHRFKCKAWANADLSWTVMGSSKLESSASTTFSSSKYQKLFSESMSVGLNRFRLHRPENPSEGKKILSVDDQRGLVSTFGSLRSPGFGKNLRVLSIARRLGT